MVSFALFMAAAVCGWAALGWGVIGAKRHWPIADFWRAPLPGAVGLVAAMAATVGASALGRWWWGLVLLLLAPNVTMLLILNVGERLYEPWRRELRGAPRG